MASAREAQQQPSAVNSVSNISSFVLACSLEDSCLHTGSLSYVLFHALHPRYDSICTPSLYLYACLCSYTVPSICSSAHPCNINTHTTAYVTWHIQQDYYFDCPVGLCPLFKNIMFRRLFCVSILWLQAEEAYSVFLHNTNPYLQAQWQSYRVIVHLSESQHYQMDCKCWKNY